jgi:4-hydroxybenzoate polyprenyltransferase/phosphoserine phosphatase
MLQNAGSRETFVPFEQWFSRKMSTFAIDAAQSEQQSQERPLVVDLDGTLLRSDMLLETAFASFGQNPLSLLAMARALLSGKAGLKHLLAANVDFAPELLPFDDAVLAKIHEAKSRGRKVYLASASSERAVSAVAAHLGLFDGIFASDKTTNLAGNAKAQRLVVTFGEAGFDYIGNGRADLPVWKKANKRIAIRCSPSVVRRLQSPEQGAEILHSPVKPSIGAWLKLLRVHQYSKNALLFVPLVTAQAFSTSTIFTEILAFIAFSLCASSIYILNDIIDLAADRSHPTKRNRPFAAGVIPLAHGLIAAPLLFVAGTAVAATISLKLLGVLLCYVALSTAYTLFLKRKLLLDVVVLAGLYTMRVIAGAVAIDVFISQWLFGFSLFIFMTLALVKRYTELAVRLDKGLANPSNRNYRIADLSVIAALAAAAGFNSVTVFALYISSDAVRVFYRRPEILWLFCPVLIYWIGRMLILAHRREMHDDPIVFALRDRISYIALAVAGVILLAAK